MLRASFAAVLTLAATSARAEPLNLYVENLLGAATVYFGEKAEKSRVLLIANKQGDADLLIYVPDGAAPINNPSMKLVFTKQEVAFSGPMGGQEASLAVTDRGSLVVKSLNLAIGRNKWEKAITIVQKGGEYQVVGVTYSSHDGLDLKGGGSCDLNLATGRGKRNGKPVTFKAAPIRLADWSDEKMPKECSFG